MVEEERKILQKMAVRTNSSQSSKKVTKVEDSAVRSTHRSSTIQPKGLSMYNQPRKMPNCRICKELEKRGDNAEMYDGHQGNYATHCPRWCAMTNEERSDVAKAAKFCLLCMDPKVTYNPGNTSKHKCISNATKNRFSCSVNRCCYHSWVCTRHKPENKNLMEKFKQEMEKRNMTFAYFANLSSNLEVSPKIPPSDASIMELGSTALPSQPNGSASVKRKPPDLTINQALQKLKDLKSVEIS